MRTIAQSCGFGGPAISQLRIKSLSKAEIYRKIEVWSGARMGSPKILCAVYSDDNHRGLSNVRGQYEYWGKRCDQFLVFTSKGHVDGIPDGNIAKIDPSIDSSDNMWQKVRTVIRHAAKMPEYDFLLMCGDDSFAIPENIRKMANEPQTKWFTEMRVPMIVGHRMVTGERTDFASSVGVVINRWALKMLSVAIDLAGCQPQTKTPSDDVILAFCAASLGIRIFNSADEFGEDRMLPFGPDLWAHLVQNPNAVSWYPPYRNRPMPKGLAAVSKYTFLIHYMSGHDPKEAHDELYGRSLGLFG